MLNLLIKLFHYSAIHSDFVPVCKFCHGTSPLKIRGFYLQFILLAARPFNARPLDPGSLAAIHEIRYLLWIYYITSKLTGLVPTVSSLGQHQLYRLKADGHAEERLVIVYGEVVIRMMLNIFLAQYKLNILIRQ